MKNPDVYLTPIGSFLIRRLRRLTQIREKVKGLPSTDYADYTDELPQLYSILKGDISFVGPRPALFNQDDLVELRTGKGMEGRGQPSTQSYAVPGRSEVRCQKGKQRFQAMMVGDLDRVNGRDECICGTSIGLLVSLVWSCGEVAEDLFTRGLCLPSGTAMTKGDLDRVIDMILKKRN